MILMLRKMKYCQVHSRVSQHLGQLSDKLCLGRQNCSCILQILKMVITSYSKARSLTQRVLMMSVLAEGQGIIR